MSTPSGLSGAIAALHAVLEPYGRTMSVTQDTRTDDCVETGKIGRNRKPVFFAALPPAKAGHAFHRSTGWV